MRKRIVREQNVKIDVKEHLKEVERRIQVRKDLVYITSKLEKVPFSEAKKLIKWDCIKQEVKRLETLKTI